MTAVSRGAGLWCGGPAPQNPGCLPFGIYPYFPSPDGKDGFYFWSFERKEMQGFFGGVKESGVRQGRHTP